MIARLTLIERGVNGLTKPRGLTGVLENHPTLNEPVKLRIEAENRTVTTAKVKELYQTKNGYRFVALNSVYTLEFL